MNKLKLDKMKDQIAKLDPRSSKAKMLSRKFKIDLTPAKVEVEEPVKKVTKKKA